MTRRASTTAIHAQLNATADSSGLTWKRTFTSGPLFPNTSTAQTSTSYVSVDNWWNEMFCCKAIAEASSFPPMPATVIVA